jgi:hypothetical protein
MADTLQTSQPFSIIHRKTRDDQANSGVATYQLIVYEAGPGYSMPNSIPAAAVENESLVMKSLAAGAAYLHAAVAHALGTATLDAFLNRAWIGFKTQAFFTFSRNRHYWSSHAAVTSGGQVHMHH